MNKTMRNVLITMVALIAIAGALVAALVTGSCSTTASQPLSGMRADAVNLLIEQSGIKGRIEDTLRTKGYEVAEGFGIAPDMIDYGIDQLAISDWKAIPQPDDAVEVATYDLPLADVDALVTTYEDPSYITVDAYGQTVTFEVPESAQDFVPLLDLVQYIPEEMLDGLAQ